MTTGDSPDISNLHVSPWTRGEKIRRAAWYLVRATLFRCSPRTAWSWRRWLLRCFGATVHRAAHIRNSARIEIPWNLTLGEDASIGEHAIIYNLGPITIGKRVTISQYAHLCAGTHDFSRIDMPLVRPPIRIRDDAWVAAEAFVGPNVTVDEGTILGARTAVFKDTPAWAIMGGNPAKVIGQREKPTK
jgi:putative colanic acid biosynthesis acetyltransferase WcaF